MGTQSPVCTRIPKEENFHSLIFLSDSGRAMHVVAAVVYYGFQTRMREMLRKPPALFRDMQVHLPMSLKDPMQGFFSAK